MKWIRKKTELRGLIGIIIMVLGVLFILGTLGVLFLCFKKWVPGGILTGISIIFTVFVIKGLEKVPEEQRWIIEVFGKYSRTLQPGLSWVCPRVEKVRTSVSIWEQRYPLFEKGIKIDFLDGSATPKDAFVFVQCDEEDDPLAAKKMVYEIKDIQEATTVLMEDVLRSYLATKTVKDAMQEGKAGDFLKEMKKEDRDKISEELKKWGLVLKRITVGSFVLDEAIIKAREEVLKADREKDVAGRKKEIMAEETMGTLIQMIAEAQGVKPVTVRKEIRKSKELKDSILKIAEDLIHRRMAIDSKSLIDIRVSGAKGMEKTLLELIAAWQKMSLPGDKAKDKTKEEKPAKAAS